MSVLDASAVLAFLQDEEGGDIVEDALSDGVISAANWSEIAQKVLDRGGDWSLVKGLLRSFGLSVEPVTIDDAETAAGKWTAGSGLSLADRLCFALADRLGEGILTADREWGAAEQVRQIR